MDEELEATTEVITTLFSAFGQSGDGIRIAAYVHVLAGVPIPLLKAICNKLILTNKFLPTVSEIVTAGKSLIEESNGQRMKTWDEAWAEIQQVCKDVFIYGKPTWSTAEIEAAVNSFGYKELCTAPQKDMQIVRAQMRQIYESVCSRAKDKQVNEFVLSGKANKLLTGVADGMKMLEES